MRFAPLLALLCGFLAASAAWAQTMYRSTMPDGSKVISDRPMPGARNVEELKLPPGNISPSPAPSGARPPAEPSRPQKLDAADAELREAQRAYDAAREAVDKGKEPLPGERLGTATGGSRLSDEYFARQKSLQDSVRAAQQRLEAAQKARGSAR